MKKIFALVLTLTLLVGVAQAANFSSIGYIDVSKVFEGYKETSKAQKQLNKKEEDFKKEFEKSQKELQKAQLSGKTSAEIESLKTKLEKDLEPKRKELLKLNSQLTASLQKDIIGAVESVSKKVGVDVVLDKQVIITGGLDITDMVISKLNK